METYMRNKKDTEEHIRKNLTTASTIIEKLGWGQGYDLEPKKTDKWHLFPAGIISTEEDYGNYKVGIYEAITMFPNHTYAGVQITKAKYAPYLNEATVCAVIQRINDFEMPVEKTALDRKIFLQRWNRNINPEKGEWLVLEALREASEQSNLAEIFCQLIEEAERRGEI